MILDGEEEAGSPNLIPAIERYRHRLSADLLLIFDGPRISPITGGRIRWQGHNDHRPDGVRAPNPAMQLSQLLASIKDAGGRVIVERFYDGIDVTPAPRFSRCRYIYAFSVFDAALTKGAGFIAGN